jgi:hypothetical protein
MVRQQPVSHLRPLVQIGGTTSLLRAGVSPHIAKWDDGPSTHTRTTGISSKNYSWTTPQIPTGSISPSNNPPQTSHSISPSSPMHTIHESDGHVLHTMVLRRPAAHE